MNHRPSPLTVAALTLSAAAVALALASPRARAAQRLDAGVLPRFDASPFAEEKTPAPTPAEWKPVDPVALTASTRTDCNAYRLREWVRIRCHLGTSVLAQIGGSREGVSLFVEPQNNWMPLGGEVMFPVRRGDRRVFEWSTFGDSYDGIGTPEVAFMISESWAPGDAAPTLLVR